MHQPAPGPRPIPTKVRTIPMSQKRNRKARSQALKPVIAASPNPARLSLAVPDEEVLDDPKWAEMGANDTDFQISTLTFRQQSALPAIAMASTITQAARDSGIGKTTLHRWLQEPEFRQQLANYRQESADLARQQAQALLPRCLTVFAEVMESPDPSLRLRAARYAVAFALQLAEVQDLKATLHQLEQSVQSYSDSHPPKLA